MLSQGNSILSLMEAPQRGTNKKQRRRAKILKAKVQSTFSYSQNKMDMRMEAEIEDMVGNSGEHRGKGKEREVRTGQGISHGVSSSQTCHLHC